jgi:predicted NACHT family NTPase
MLRAGSIDRTLLAKYGLQARIPLSFRRIESKRLVTKDGIPPQDLPKDGSVITAQQLITEIIRDLGGLSAVLIGDSGAGKTTFLLDLTTEVNKTMRKRFKAGKPHILPIWLDLSSWSAMMRFQDWLEDRVGLEYSVSKETIRQWVDEDALLIVLDNFSWLPLEARSRCVATLGAFIAEHPGTGLLLAANDEMIRPFMGESNLTVLRLQEPTTEELRTCLDQFKNTHTSLIRGFRSSPELVAALRRRIFCCGCSAGI